MGYYKQFKQNLRQKVTCLLEEWIVAQEKPDGNKVWDRYSSVSQAAAEFSAHLHDHTMEADPTSKDRTFMVCYEDQTVGYTTTIKCPTSNHARILFQREHPNCTITNLEDITDKVKE